MILYAVSSLPKLMQSIQLFISVLVVIVTTVQENFLLWPMNMMKKRSHRSLMAA